MGQQYYFFIQLMFFHIRFHCIIIFDAHFVKNIRIIDVIGGFVPNTMRKNNFRFSR